MNVRREALGGAGAETENSCSPSPMAHLPALETCARISTEFSTEFCETSPTMGDFHANFVTHKKVFVILGYTFLGCFTTLRKGKGNLKAKGKARQREKRRTVTHCTD